METLILFIIFAAGASLGAFANVLIYRIPRNVSIILPNSFCTKCTMALKWRDKIPLLSYFLNGSKCRYCKARIPLFYPLSEFFSGMLAIFCHIYFSATTSALAFFFLVLLFYTLSVIDTHFLAIPDSLSFLTLALSLTFAVLYFNEPLLACITCLSFIGFATFLRLFVGFLTKKETLGEGDLLLFGTIGCTLGAFYGAIAIFLAAVYALIFILIAQILRKNKEMIIPFVPFLFLGFLSTFMWQMM